MNTTFHYPSVAYFDYASAFPPAATALEAMAHAARESWGHPGALHAHGARARMALDYARRAVAEYLGTTWQEIVFAPTARSALRLGLSTLLHDLPPGARIVASRQDHPALLRMLEELGSTRPVDYLALPGGQPDAEDLRRLASASAVVLSLVPRFAHLDAPLLDLHGFRQTQVAITIWSRIGSIGPFPSPPFG